MPFFKETILFLLLDFTIFSNEIKTENDEHFLKKDYKIFSIQKF